MNREEFRKLYERHAGHVYGRCRYLLRDEDAARDAVQEVFLKALEHGDGFRSEAQPSTWLIRIATNHCLNVLRMRRNKTRQAVEDGEIPIAATPQALWGSDRAERRELVKQLLARVDDEVAQVAVHYFVDEMTQDEIGRAIGRSLPTIRKRLKEFVEAAGIAMGEQLPVVIGRG